MTFSKKLTCFPAISALLVAAGACVLLPSQLVAAESNEAPQKPAVAQRSFASPDDAITALRAAAETKDQTALNEIFGPQFRQILTGDPVQDSQNAQRFAAALAEGCKAVNENDDRFVLQVGTNEWPMPIPLVKADGQWHFDTAAGADEIINRHIGKDELHAIGVCRAYVTAQRQFATAKSEGGDAQYALKFKSTPGKKDGLYWASSENEQASPFGPLVAEAHAEGYGGNNGAGPHPFHGYYFRVITKQGESAPGGKLNYMHHGHLTRGFALVAYPEHWDKSGIMTFIVNQDGKIYQQNLGEKTCRIAAKMTEYDPGSEWSLVQDQGIVATESEK